MSNLQSSNINKLNQRGAVHFLLLLILLIGLAAGVYLVTSGDPLKLFSSAANPPIVFKDLDGKPLPVNKRDIAQATSASVIVELTSTLGPPRSVSLSRPITSGTVSYKIAENPAELNQVKPSAYRAHPTVLNYTFKGQKPGVRFIWVEFQDTRGKVDRRSARIEIIKPTGPENSFTLIGPTGCNAGILCIFSRQHALKEEFAVELDVRSDTETANLFNAKMTFPKDLVEVKEIKKEGSFVDNWVEEFYDNNTGEISLTGGVRAPGYQTTVGGKNALMATIVFRAKATGKGMVSFMDDSEILSNRSNVNILTIKRGYDFTVDAKPLPSPTPSIGTIVQLLPPADSVTPNGSGEVNVEMFAYDTDSYLATVNISGTFKGLVPNRIYKVWTCLSTESDCSSDGTEVKADASGSANFSNLKDTFYNRPTNPVASIKIVEAPPPGEIQPQTCYLMASPCLKGSYYFPIPMPSGTPIPTPAPGSKGDGNQDGKIDLVDMSVLHTDWKADKDMNKVVRPGIDMNDDGLVNAFDFTLLRNLLLDLGVIKDTIILR